MKKYINANIKASEPPEKQDETTDCPECNTSLLEAGIDEKVAISGAGYLYHRNNGGSLQDDGVEDTEYDIDDNIRYNCGGCGYELNYSDVENLIN